MATRADHRTGRQKALARTEKAVANANSVVAPRIVRSTTEQQEAFIQHIYDSYAELQRQSEEVNDRKHRIDFDVFQSNQQDVHELLFCNIEIHDTELGDWDTWEKVETVVNKFAYGRPYYEHDAKDSRDEIVCLQERISALNTTVVRQRKKIGVLNENMTATQEELDALRHLLRMKDQEIRALVSKNNTANLQMRAVKRELEVLQGIFSNNGDQQICEDLRLLIEANKALEKENAEMRAKLHAKYGLIPKTPGLEVVEDGESSVAKPTILSLADDMGEDDELQSLNNLLMDDARRMDYIESEIPISGVILQMKKSNLEWMQRLEMEVGNAMAMLDADANAWADHRELNDNFNYPLFDNGDFAAYAYKNALELRVPRNSVVTTVAPGVYRPKGANGRTNSVNSASGVAVGGGVHVASSNNIHGGHHSPVNPLRSWRDEMPRKNLSLESLHQLDRSVLGKSIPESDTTRRGSGDPFARHPSMSHSTDVGGEVASARDGGTFVYGRPIPSVPNVATTPGERSDARMKFLRRFSSYQSIPQVLDAGGSTSETSQHEMPSTHSSAHQPAAGQTLPGPSAGGATWRALRTGVISIAEFSRSEALKREALHINQLRSRIVALNMNVAAISQAAQRNPDVLSKMSEEDHHAMDISQNYPSVVMMMHSLAEAASACTVTVMKDSDQNLAEKSCVEANAFGTSISAPGKPMSAGAAGVAEEEDQDLDEYSQTRNGRSMLETAAPSDRGDATVSIIRDCDPFFSTTDDDAERTKLKLWAYEEGASPYYLTTADIVRLILSRDGADQLREMSNAEIAQHVLNHDCTDLLHGISVTELRDAMIRHGASPSLIDQWGEDGIITAALLNSDRHLMGNIPPEDFVRLLMSGSSTTSACEELLRQHATQLEQEALSKMDAITARFAASLEGKSVAELRTLLIASFQATLSAKFATTQLRAELLQLRRQSHDLKLEVSAFIELMKSLFGAAHRQGRARPAEPEHDPLATMQAMEEELRGVTDDILADMTEKRVLDTLRNNFGIALEEEELSPSMTDENWVAQRLRQVALEVAKNRVVATKRASIRSNERLTKWGNNEPYYLHHLEDESSTVPTLASDQPIMVQGVAHREVRRNDAKRGSDFLRDAEAKARILDQFLHGHGEGGLLPESLFCSEILGAGGAGRGMMMTPDAVQGIAGGGGGGGGGHGGGRLEDAFDARNEDARRRRWPDFIPDDHGTDMDGIPSDFALRGRRIGPEGEIRQIGTKWYYITPVEGPLPPSATPPPSTDVVRHGASRDILAYLRSLRPPPAGGPEGIRPIVYAYKFDKAFSETKRIAQWRLRDGLAKLYGSDFDDIMSLVLPIATAAKNLKSGKGLNAQLVDAIRQLRAEEEARRKHDTRALFRRVATNIRSRLLMKKNVFHGSPFPAFVAVLYDRWRDSMEKQREASRRSQVVHAQRLLDLLGIVQNSATEVERETPTRPLRKPHLPPLSSPARQAISYANAPSSKHFDQAKF